MGSNENGSQNGEAANPDDADDRSVFIKNVDFGADDT